MKPIIFDLYSIFVQINDVKIRPKIASKKGNTDADISMRHNLLEFKSLIIYSRRVEKAYQIATSPETFLMKNF